MFIRKILSFVTILTLCICLPGCFATVFKGKNSNVEMTSIPTGADVYVNGQLVGQTPIKVKLESNKSHTIEFRKVGYKSQTKQLSSGIGPGWVILDVACGLVPVVVDAATGSWYSLDEDHVKAVLEKE